MNETKSGCNELIARNIAVTIFMGWKKNLVNTNITKILIAYFSLIEET